VTPPSARPPAELGIDLGTSGVKALLCARDGSVLGQGVAGYQVSTPRPAMIAAAATGITWAGTPDRSGENDETVAGASQLAEVSYLRFRSAASH
jgi:xylulokinase